MSRLNVTNTGGAKGTATISGKAAIAAFYVDESKPYPKGPVAFLTTAGGRYGEFDEAVLQNPGPGKPTPRVTCDAKNAYVTFDG